MILLPAIDLYAGKAVRLLRGDYEKMTVYGENAAAFAAAFADAGAEWVHMVDLEGAKSGTTPNFETVAAVAGEGKLRVEIGGGIRSEDTAARYLEAGVSRVILGTAALRDRAFLERCVTRWGEKIAVGADIKNGYIAISGWTESSGIDAFSFCRRMQDLGVKTLICTDISRDGAMQGTNRNLYRTLSKRHDMNIIASGGVSSLADIRALRALGVYGAILGKAYYTGAISLRDALEAAK